MKNNVVLQIIIWFPLAIVGCRNMVPINTYNDIENKTDELKKLYYTGLEEDFVKSYNNYMQLSTDFVKNIIDTTIKNNPNDIDRVCKALFIAGLLKVKDLGETINGLSKHGLFPINDIRLEIAIDFYYVNVYPEKHQYFEKLKFIADSYIRYKKDELVPIPGTIIGHAYYTVELLGWVFDDRVLKYLEAYDSTVLDGGFSETLWESINRIKLILNNK